MGGSLIARLRCSRCVRRSLRGTVDAVRDGRLRHFGHACTSGVASLLSEHPVEHSRLLDTCLDVGVIRVVEAVNVSICPTLWSCQGDPRGSGGVDWPGITIPGEHWPTMRAWLARHGVDWSEHVTARDSDGHRVLVPPTDRSDSPVTVWAAGERPGDGNTHLNFRGVEPHEVFAPVIPGPGR